MAVHSILTEKDIKKILNNYDIGKLISFFGIKDGIENTNYLIRTEVNKFILTIFENRVKISELPFFYDLMQNSFNKNINCPTVVERLNGKNSVLFQKKQTSIFTFLNGKCLKNWNINNCYDVGSMLGMFHKKNKNFKKRIYNHFGIKEWKRLFSKCKQDINRILPFEKDFIEKELAFLIKNWPLNSLPKGIIHADLFPDNVLFENRKISGIIDFYFSCYDFLAYDLAILVNAWCFSKKNFKQDFYENLIKGYQSVRPLTKNEKKKFNILLRGASMRFLMTRIFDKIHTPKKNNVTIKDPSEYLFKLKFHQSNNDSDAYF